MRQKSRKIRIAFDASCLVTDQKSGVASYTQCLISHIAAQHADEVEFIGHYCNFLGKRKHIDLPQGPNISYRPSKLVSAPVLNLLRRLGLWIPFEALVKTRTDFHLFPAFIGWPSIRKTPSATLIHDVTYLDFPEFVAEKARRDLTVLVPAAIRRAAFIITNSETTAKSLRQHYNLAKQQVVVGHIPPQGVRQLSGAESDKVVLRNLGITQPFILFLGNLEPRKNLAVLLDAYEQLRPELKKLYTLVIAGAPGWLHASIMDRLETAQQAGIALIVTGYVDEQQRAALLGGASALVLPSLYEGFGMTLLEAMAYETPVLASDIEIFHEVCGEAARYFDPHSPSDLAQQLAQVLTNPSLAQQLVTSGKANLQRFSWEATADTIYKRLKDTVYENRH